MFSHISTLGWVIIIGLAVFILSINLGLLFGVKQSMQKDNWITKLSNARDVLKDPLKKENEQYKELSEKVQQFKEK